MVKNLSIRVREMTQWLKRLATHVEDMGSVPTTHVTTHVRWHPIIYKSNSRESHVLFL